MHICLPQYLPGVTTTTASISNSIGTWYWCMSIYDDLMINPSLMLLKSMPYSGAIFHALSLFNLIHKLWSLLDGDCPIYIVTGVVHLYLCHVTRNNVVFYQQRASPCSGSCFDDISANLDYVQIGISQTYWILVIGIRNNVLVIVWAANISSWIISWGTDMLFIMQAIIETKGLSKSY